MVTRTPTPPKSFDPSPLVPSQSCSSVGTLISVNSDDSDSEIWAKPPPKLPSSHNNRPVLAPIDTDSSPGSQTQPLPRDNSKIPVPGYIPDTPPLRNTRRNNVNAKKLQDQRISRFDNNFEVTWAPRPPPEEVFERLEEYFPEHDIDEPVIDMPSGGTSPTSAEPNQPLPVEKQKFRHKKSIRLVAEEHKKRIDRRSRMEPAANANNTLRKRNTKLWGSRLEEVPTHDQALLPTSAGTPSDSSPGTAKPIFRWVRGELIGKGTYGKVYLALNATTGEMIAVKQVEMPRTASDRDDSRQVSVVEALKLESETLKDLDHPNIVQYLGFEETPTFLSIFLEYVPGGSIASCLRKHGKFDEDVTKSFTGQILSGLEYLHSKGILHRDLKADNILVETTGICKISDFGISKRTDDINMAGAYTSMQGTVFWMAPEVIDANKRGYNSKIDIWSVGCVVFEMWTGQRPWSGREAMAVLLQLYQTKEGPPVPQEIVLSPLADDFRQKCFATNPDERPTAAELRKHPYLELQPDWAFNGFR
ncbi:Pkinase-domain-containing protein [Irpex rosettiformis]|uniref:Pkinase-domain-containing protein n=1 Tax=Irpex rosettiformis TaxID=378272 RepID=A0ACB8UN15_9APHY|nr:Pkinase-domain-containing protein [Irpex rosettiformis]